MKLAAALGTVLAGLWQIARIVVSLGFSLVGLALMMDVALSEVGAYDAIFAEVSSLEDVVRVLIGAAVALYLAQTLSSIGSADG